MKKILCIFLLMIHSGLALYGQKQILTVIPEPRQYSFLSGSFQLLKQSVEIKKYCAEYEQLNLAIDELCQILKEKDVTISSGENLSKKILLGIPSEDKNFRQICKDHGLLPGENLGDEGYCLLIDSEIIIAANTQKGLFYAIQTLKQIIRGAGNKKFLPAVKITDWPAFKYRGVMDDISRGPVPAMAYMKYQIRRLAEMKINTFMHYVEHVVKTKSHPAFAPPDGSLTIEEWKELKAYAAKYNVSIVGSFQSFGHFNNILASPEYAHLGESNSLISPVLPESYSFLKDIYAEMVPAFNAPFFNINCDETFDLGKGASKKLVDSLGYAGAYYSHIIKLYEILKQLNSGMMMWGDVILEHPELLNKLPKDIIIGTWTYDDLASYSKFIDPIKEAGFRFLAVPGVLNSGRIFPQYKQALGNIKGFAKAADKSGAMGILNTVWDDGGTALFSNDWYGAAYGADKSWNTDSHDSTDFDRRFNFGLFGAADNKLTEAIRLLGSLSELEPTDGLNDKILFERLTPDSGKTFRISINEWDKVLGVSLLAESLLEGIRSEKFSDEMQSVLFTAALYKALASERLDLVKASDNYSRAERISKSDPVQARDLILKALDQINGIIERETAIRNRFENLWLKENRTYALNRITEKYDRKIEDYKDVKSRISASLVMLDSSRPVIPPENVRLAIIPIRDKYFREWLVVNPIPLNRNNMAKDYLAVIGGERNVIPKVTQEFVYDSVSYRWTRAASAYQDKVDLKEIFTPQFSPLTESVLTYAFATIESSRDTVIKACAGCSGEIKIFVNGETAFQKEAASELTDCENFFSMALHKGINNLMLKVSSGKSAWGFTFRLSDCQVRSRKNRYKLN